MFNTFIMFLSCLISSVACHLLFSWFWLDSGNNIWGWASNGDFPLYDVIFLTRVILHLSIGRCDEMSVGNLDLPWTIKCLLAFKPSNQYFTVGFWKPNSAKLSDSIVSAGVDMRLCCEDINKFILHDCTIWVEPITRESHVGRDVAAIQFIWVVWRHRSIPLESHSSIDGESLRETFSSEVSQTVWVLGKHWHSVLQNMREHLPWHRKFPGSARCMNHEVSMRVVRLSIPFNRELLTIDSSGDVLRVGHVTLK